MGEIREGEAIPYPARIRRERVAPAEPEPDREVAPAIEPVPSEPELVPSESLGL